MGESNAQIFNSLVLEEDLQVHTRSKQEIQGLIPWLTHISSMVQPEAYSIYFYLTYFPIASPNLKAFL